MSSGLERSLAGPLHRKSGALERLVLRREFDLESHLGRLCDRAPQRQTLYIHFCKQMILHGLVALTGVETVSRRPRQSDAVVTSTF